jgi:osmotically-inducible protein OsmY
MSKWFFLALTAVILTSAFTGCESTRPERGRVESKSELGDSDLENRIKARINSDEQLKAADLSVIADADKKETTLSGTVQSSALRSRAVELAKSAEPDLKVNDMIEVKPRELARQDFTNDLARREWAKAKHAGDRVSTRVEDAWIHAKVVAKLIGNPDAPARSINVDVFSNVVTLRGKVGTPEEKSLAQRLAQQTEGVKRVENELRVGV